MLGLRVDLEQRFLTLLSKARLAAAEWVNLSADRPDPSPAFWTSGPELNFGVRGKRFS
jgi:hypothetical protein